jgi:DNA invertase Pin-like site-specific DNA recombinase
MRIGIYLRKDDPKMPTIEWLIANNFDSFEIYEETIEDEFEDISQREELNTLLHDGEHGHIDAVFVQDLRVLSAITLKVLQVLIEIQKLNLPVHFNSGCIFPTDRAIQAFQEQIQNHWDKIKNDIQKIDFSGIESKIN